MESGVVPRVPEVIAELIDTAVQAGTASWAGCDDAELLGALEAIPQLRNAVDALAGNIAAAAKTTGACARAGFRRPDLFTGAKTNDPPANTRRDIALNQWLLDFAQIREAFETGDISARHVREIKKIADRSFIVTALKDPDHQQLLVWSAINCNYRDFERALAAWLNAIDPDGQLADEKTAKAGISMRRGIDGSLAIDGELDPIRGTEIYAAIQAEKNRLEAVDDESGPHRSDRQLNLEALLNLVRRGATRTDGSLAQPLINVVMGHNLAEALIETLKHPDHQLDFANTFDTKAWDPTGTDIDRRCTFIDGTPLHPKLALSVFGAQTLFRRVIFNPGERPQVSTDTRFFPTWQKQVKLVETLGDCEENGCDARTHWLQGDHHQPHSKGGKTTYENLRMICGPGNGAKGNTDPP